MSENKIRKKVGRPRKQGVLREANGRASRSEKSQFVNSVSMRAKHMNISIKDALDPKSSSNLGRLCLLGKRGLSQKQYDAALKFLSVVNNYKKSLLSKDAIHEPRVSLNLLVSSEERYVKWCLDARKEFDNIYQKIQQAEKQGTKKNLLFVVHHVLIQDRWMPHLLSDIRYLCDLLHAQFFSF